MSSNYITSVQTQQASRLQGAQPVSRSPELKRNDSAASGENLPLNRMDESGERTRAGQVESAVSKISNYIQTFQRDLVFTIDEESDRLVVKVVDSVTQEVIRQIPE